MCGPQQTQDTEKVRACRATPDVSVRQPAARANNLDGGNL